jgi:hypothetical protein
VVLVFGSFLELVEARGGGHSGGGHSGEFSGGSHGGFSGGHPGGTMVAVTQAMDTAGA